MVPLILIFGRLNRLDGRPHPIGESPNATYNRQSFGNGFCVYDASVRDQDSMRRHNLLRFGGYSMSRQCQLTGKKANNAYAISHSHRRTKKLQQANLQSKRVWWAEGNRWVKLKLSTKAIKTLEKKGLQAMAKEAGINLNHY